MYHVRAQHWLQWNDNEHFKTVGDVLKIHFKKCSCEERIFNYEVIFQELSWKPITLLCSRLKSLKMDSLALGQSIQPKSLNVIEKENICPFGSALPQWPNGETTQCPCTEWTANGPRGEVYRI